MRQLSRCKGVLGKPAELPAKMNGAPRIVIDGLLERFTETAKGSSRSVLPGIRVQARALTVLCARR